jgi:hypothetical protein
MTCYLIRNAEGHYLIRDDEFTEDKAKACYFKTYADAASSLEEGETIEPTEEK